MTGFVSSSVFSVFVPTFIVVSATPGMCMTLALTLGMQIGVKRTLWMVLGELTGVAVVAVSALLGVAAIMLNYPTLFQVFRIVGGVYLAYLGYQLWLSKGKMAISNEKSLETSPSPYHLISQGFITAIANPKGWAFFIALLPPFINNEAPITPQIVVLIGLITIIEFCFLMLYASGGKGLHHFLHSSGKVHIVNRIAGVLMVFVGIWLALG